jgi:hypothetical protein
MNFVLSRRCIFFFGHLLCRRLMKGGGDVGSTLPPRSQGHRRFSFNTTALVGRRVEKTL